MISATLGLDIGPFLDRLEKVKHKLNEWAGTANVFSAGALFGSEVMEGANKLIEKLHGVVEMGAHLNDLSAATGQSVHDLVVLQQAFQNAGLGADSVGPAIAKFQKALSGVNEDGLPTNHALERLALNIAGFRDMPAIEQFRQLQGAFERIHSPIERTQLAMELFGKKGAKMLALLSEGGGFNAAEEQVGGLAETMQNSAKVFQEVSTAITTLGQKAREVFAGAFAEILPGIKDGLQGLTRIDLTSVGEKLGHVAVQIGSLVQEIWRLKPLLEALAVQFALGLNGAKAAAGLQFVKNQLTAVTQAIKSPADAWGGLQILMGQSAGAGFFATVRAGLNGMLGQTLAVTAAITAVMWAWNHYQQRKDAVALTAFGGVDKELVHQSNQDINEAKGIETDEQKGEVIKKLDQQLGELHERVASVDEDFAGLGSSPENDAERAKITQRLLEQIAVLQHLHNRTQGLTQAQMDANKADRDAANAKALQAKAVQDLIEKHRQLQEQLQKEVAKRDFDALTPEQQQSQLQGEADTNSFRKGSFSAGSIDAQIAADADAMQSGRMTDPQDLARANRLVEIRQQLLEVEKRLAQEKDKQAKADADAAEKAAAAKKQADDFDRRTAQDILKLRAEGRGDQAEVARIDRQQRFDQEYEQATGVGKTDEDARHIANAKVQAQDAAKAEKEREKEKPEKEGKVQTFADSDRRVGLGGVGVAARTDPLIKAHQDAARATQGLKGSIDTLTAQLKQNPERIILPGKAVFA